MKKAAILLWTVIRYIFGFVFAFAGMLIALPCALLYTVANGLINQADKIVPKVDDSCNWKVDIRDLFYM